MNEIDKLDGMVKIKGKCGYEIIGGCRELRKAKAKLEKIKEICNSYARTEDYVICSTFNEFLDKVFNIVIGAEDGER